MHHQQTAQPQPPTNTFAAVWRHVLQGSQGPTPLRVVGGPFRGARLALDLSCSKRKMCGRFEHVLNSWWRKALPGAEVFWDVGAADGYYTFGCAHELKKRGRSGHIVAFEPDQTNLATLEWVAGWPEYEGLGFELLPLFVGAASSEKQITLDDALRGRPALQGKPSLIKVDVEGDEIKVLSGASLLLDEPHRWVVEVHGDHLLADVISHFKAHGRAVDVIDPKAHWLFGPEQRSIKTRWITTKIP
jgi:hypothetical protein